MVEISSRPGCSVPPYDALRWWLCDHLSWEMFFLSSHSVTDYRSAAKLRPSLCAFARCVGRDDVVTDDKYDNRWRRGWGCLFVLWLDLALLSLFVVPSAPLRAIAGTVLMNAHGNKENFFHVRACCLALGRGCVEKCRKGVAAAWVLFLVYAMELARKTFSALLENRKVEQVIHNRVLDVLACIMH